MKIRFNLQTLGLVLLLATTGLAQSANVINSYRAKADFTLTADPNAPAWKNVKGVIAERGPHNDVTPGHRTEIRAVWTDKNLYLLFICAYEAMYPKPNPTTTTETNKLWEWDVAEAFIGSDFQNIKRYTEYQVSPQGEWVDLDIDRGPQPAVHNVAWDSGFEVKAQVNAAKKVWYGAMRIPYDKLDKRAAKIGNELRVNFYRFQGPPPDRKRIAWQPTNSDNYHTPEAFGLLKLVK